MILHRFGQSRLERGEPLVQGPVFAGGVLGGLLARGGGASTVFWTGAMLAAVWLYTARGFKDAKS